MPYPTTGQQCSGPVQGTHNCNERLAQLVMCGERTVLPSMMRDHKFRVSRAADSMRVHSSHRRPNTRVVNFSFGVSRYCTLILRLLS